MKHINEKEAIEKWLNGDDLIPESLEDNIFDLVESMNSIEIPAPQKTPREEKTLEWRKKWRGKKNWNCFSSSNWSKQKRTYLRRNEYASDAEAKKYVCRGWRHLLY